MVKARIRANKATFNPRDQQSAVHDGLREYTDGLSFLNDALEEVGIETRIAFSQHYTPSNEFKQKVINEMRSGAPAIEVIKRSDGAIPYPDKGIIVANVLALLNTPKHVVLEAETQFGKTSVTIATIATRVLINESEENPELIALVNPNNNIGADATNNDLENFVEIHGGMHVEGRYFTLRRAYDEGHIRSFKRSKTSVVNNIDQAAQHIGCNIITLVVDEGDLASAQNSVLNSWVTELRNRGYLVRLLLISATNYPYSSLDYEYYQVDIPDDSGYCGTVSGKRTPVAGYTQLAKIVKVPQLCDFTLSAYTNNVLNRSTMKQKEARLQAEMLADVILKTCLFPSTCSDAKALGLNGLYFNGGRAGFVRIGTAAVTAHFERVVTPILRKHGIKVISYHGSGMKRKGKLLKGQSRTLKIEDFLAETEGFCLFVVKGALRRQERIPRECTMAFDFTDTFGTTTAMEQGTMGRLSGWNKITDQLSSFAVVSDDNEKMISLFRQDYDYYRKFGKGIKIPRSNPGSNSVILENYLPRKMVLDQVAIDFSNPVFAHLKPLQDRLTDIFSQVVHRPGKNKTVVNKKQQAEAKLVQHNGKGSMIRPQWAKNDPWSLPADPKRAQNTLNYDFAAIIGPFISDIENAIDFSGINAKLLIPGIVRADGVHYPVNELNHVEVDMRNHFIKYGGKGGKKTSGHNDRTTIIDKGMRRRLRIAFDLRGKTKVHQITLLTEREYCKYESLPAYAKEPVTVGPSPKSMHSKEQYVIPITREVA